MIELLAFLDQFPSFSLFKIDLSKTCVVIVNDEGLHIGADASTPEEIVEQLKCKISRDDWKPASFSGYYRYCP